MKDGLSTVIGEGQTACVQGKSCIHNLIYLRNVLLSSATSASRKCAIISIDLEKAFDRVNQQFLWKCLEKFGYPVRLINILKNLYRQATSRILVNGFLTNQVNIKRFVSQGCPLSTQ
jgi:hypothetical protein